MDKHKNESNELGVTPFFFERIMNLHYLLGELKVKLTNINRLKSDAVQYAGKPKGQMSADAIPGAVKEAEELYINIKIFGEGLPQSLMFDDNTKEALEYGSSCCFAPLIPNTDICSRCKEHAGLVSADYGESRTVNPDLKNIEIDYSGCELRGNEWVITTGKS